ncbi:GTP-binding protein [Marinomonas posidonica]|uniref:CobW C-terminal domain-containing protein n=1 Tax=Marinomonas posidonica (strain CECT 7376 / NCIMB 14433 / IVIA-Po-181) TaxID=491952 RepID=F6CUH8_MARPP|nr:hypothetical protein Mar181_3382 [Marinomonas posidonica IVIA-Po-181]
MFPNADIELGSTLTAPEVLSSFVAGKIVPHTFQRNKAIQRQRLESFFQQHHSGLIRAKGIIHIYETNVTRSLA